MAEAHSLEAFRADCATLVATTSKVLGTTGLASRKTKPNKLVLSVADLGS